MISFKFVDVCFMARIRSVLVNGPMVLAKSVHSAVVGWSVVSMVSRSCWLVVLLISFISMPIFCLVLSTVKGIVLTCPTIIVYLFIYPFSSVRFFAPIDFF